VFYKNEKFFIKLHPSAINIASHVYVDHYLHDYDKI